MKWQFIRFYVGIAVVLLLAAVVVFISVQRDFERQVAERFERFMTPWVERVRDTLAGADGGAEARARLIDEIDYKPRFPTRHDKPRKGPPTRLIAREDVALPAEAARRLDSGEVVARREGDRHMVYATVAGGDVVVVEGIPWRSHDGRDGRERDDEATSAVWLLLAPPLGILMLIGVAVVLLIRPIERRIFSLTEATRRFGAGALDTRAQVGRTGTVDELEESFNAMTGRIQELIGNQRELMRAVSHDLRTPLARMFFALDDAQAAATADEKNRHLERMDRSLVELKDLVEELTAYLQLSESAGEPAREWIEAAPFLRQAADLVSDLRKDAALEVTGGELKVFAEPRSFKRALDNLVTNAVTHCRTGVWIACRSDNGAFVLDVEDDGEGIPEEERAKVFEPFYRKERSRNLDLGGPGLGLAIVARIMAGHKGSAAVTASPRGGACFTLAFPGGPGCAGS